MKSMQDSKITAIAIIVLALVVGVAQAQAPVKTEGPDVPLVLTSRQIFQLPPPNPPPLDLSYLAARDKNGRCKVHHTVLMEAIVPILYGLRAGPPGGREFLLKEQKEFPNALLEYSSGCFVSPVNKAKVLHCQKCLNRRMTARKRL